MRIPNNIIPLSSNLRAHYKFAEAVAAGQVGTVYKALHTPTCTTVAMKTIIRPRHDMKTSVLDNMLVREVQNISFLTKIGVNHIAKFKEAFVTHDFEDRIGRVCIIQEFIRGKTLHTWMEQKKKQYILHVVRDLLQAVQECHSHSVVHCDLKPANIMITTSVPLVRLVDFGSSYILSPEIRSVYVNHVTPKYAAPEIVLSKEASDKSDVWSLGCIFEEIVSNSHTDVDIDVELLSVLQNLIQACKQNKPEKRATVGNLIEILEMYIIEHALLKTPQTNLEM